MKGSLFLLAAAAALPLGAAQAQSVETGTGDWSAMPELQQRNEYFMSDQSMDEIEDVGRRQVCQVPGLSGVGVSLDVPFAVKFDPNGAAQRIVVRDMGCHDLEMVLGRVLAQLTNAGEYRPTGASRNGWYRSTLSFTLQ
jgi:hypothetical protein